MKKLVIIALLSVFCISMQAQVINSVSNYRHEERVKKERVPLKFEWYGKVGLNMMSTRWNGQFWGDSESIDDNETKIGANLDFGFLSHFRPSHPSNFYWGAELSLTQVGGGFKSAERGYSNPDIFDSYSYTGLGICVGPSLGWKKYLGSFIQLDLHFSPELLLVLTQPKELNYKWYSSSLEEWRYYTDSFDRSVFNFALKGGVGVWVNRFNIDLSYRGTISVDNVDNDYSNIILSVGYRF